MSQWSTSCLVRFFEQVFSWLCRRLVLCMINVMDMAFRNVLYRGLARGNLLIVLGVG